MLGAVHGPHGHSHSLDARRADSRRRMLVALAINVALLLAEASAASSPGRWRCSPTLVTCSPTSARSASPCSPPRSPPLLAQANAAGEWRVNFVVPTGTRR
jgi:Co/Zn/Cd efflux system component